MKIATLKVGLVGLLTTLVLCPVMALAQKTEISGKWDVTATSDSGESSSTWHFKKSDGKLSGTTTNEGTEREISNIKLQGNNLNFDISFENDGQSILVKVDTKLDGRNAEGSWVVNDSDGNELMTGTVQAEKAVGIADVKGSWKATAVTDDGEIKFVWKIKEKDGKVSGMIANSDNPEKEIALKEIQLKEGKLTFAFPFDYNGEAMNITVASRISGSKMKGTWTAFSDDGNEVAEGEIKSEKSGVGLAGDWDTVATVPNGDEMKSVLTLKGNNDSLKGVLNGDDRETEIDIVTVKGDEVTIEFQLDIQGNSADVVIKADIKSDKELNGNWSIMDGDGNEAATGEWKATRE